MGEKIESPWPDLDAICDIRVGDAVTVLGAPGSNKSNLLLNWLTRTRLPHIYGSFDTPITDMTARTLAILSGDTINEVFAGVDDGVYQEYAESQVMNWFTDERSFMTPVRPNEDYALIDDLVFAYAEFLGERPKAIVVDNLSDTVPSGEVHHIPLQKAFKDCRNAAARLSSTVFTLHHTRRGDPSESDDLATRPVRLADGVGAGERDAAVVLGVWKPLIGDGNTLRVAVLKNKRGYAAANGSHYIDLPLDQERAWIGD